MPDIADDANDKLEKLLEGWTDEIRRRASKPIETTGTCLNCEEPLMDHGRRWCSHDCMSDWQKRNPRA